MDVRLAPMEGVTGAVHRRVHHRLFGGVSRYYIPFITPSIHRVFTTRDLRDIDPKQNAGVPVIPQLLTRDPELFSLKPITKQREKSAKSPHVTEEQEKIKPS